MRAQSTMFRKVLSTCAMLGIAAPVAAEPLPVPAGESTMEASAPVEKAGAPAPAPAAPQTRVAIRRKPHDEAKGLAFTSRQEMQVPPWLLKGRGTHARPALSPKHRRR
jgi:hypothetical protein